MSMELKQKTSKPGLSLPGLIDIIFLLLVFAIVKLVGYQSGTKDREAGESVRTVLEGMPRINVSSAEQVRDINTLTIQIDNTVAEDASVTRRLILLKGSRDNPVPYTAALLEAITAKRVWPLPARHDPDRISAALNFQSENFTSFADSLISNIENLYTQDDQSNFIEVRAIEDTEYALIDYLLKQCTSLENRVPLLSICILHEQGA